MDNGVVSMGISLNWKTGEVLGRACIPRLSVANATPPLNLTPTTDVPVTAGEVVCVLGPVLWRYEGS